MVQQQHLDTAIRDSIGPCLKELDSVWDFIGYDNEQRSIKLQSLSETLRRCLLDEIAAENRYRSELESRIDSLKRKASQASRSLGLPPFCPASPSDVEQEQQQLVGAQSQLQLAASLEAHIAQHEAAIAARRGEFGRIASRIGDLCRRMDLPPPPEEESVGAVDDNDEFIPTEQELGLMQGKLDGLESRHASLLERFTGFCEDIRRIANDIEYLPETDSEAAILRSPAIATSSSSSSSNWPLTEASLAELQAWRLRLVKHKAMLVGTCDELRSQLAALYRRLELPEAEDGPASASRPSGYRPSDMAALQADLARCHRLRDGPLARVYVEGLRREATELSAMCFAAEADGTDASASTAMDVAELEGLVERLRERYERNRELFDAVRRYQSAWEAYLDVEQRMRDPAIFSNRGGILLKTEKEKKLLLKELPRVEARVAEQLRNCPGGGEGFTIGGLSFEQYVQRLWEDFRNEREAAKANRKLGRSSLAPGAAGGHDLSMSQQQQHHHQLPVSPRKSLAPAAVAVAKR